MELVNRSVTGQKPEIGRIDLLPEYTLFDVRKKDARKVVDALRNADFFGRRIRAEFATDRDYAREAKDRMKKAEAKKKKKSAAKPSARTDYDLSLGNVKPAAKKSKKKKEEAVVAERPKYNGNYDIFKKIEAHAHSIIDHHSFRGVRLARSRACRLADGKPVFRRRAA